MRARFWSLLIILCCICAQAQHSVTITWTNPSNSVFNGTTLTLHNNNLYRSTDGIHWTAICCVGGPYANTPITSYTDSTISAATAYFYSATAVFTTSGGSFSCGSPCESGINAGPSDITVASVVYQTTVTGPESNTEFTAGGMLPLVGGSAFVGPTLTLGVGNYLIIGTIASTLANASTATCWIMELPSTQISPLTYAGSETPAVTSLWLPITMITSVTISGSSKEVQMECTNNAGNPELGPFVLTATQISNLNN